MSKISEITRESWILNTFPEWGTWLNEEIEAEKVESGKVAMWWLANTGYWIKTENDTNLVIDLWCKTGKRTHGNGMMKDRHQHIRACGCRKVQPNRRAVPVVIDPFEMKTIDVLLATHDHSDHIDENVAAAVCQLTDNSVKFVGPKACTELWKSWGVPEERLVTVRPGDSYKVKDIEIVAVESFDRTELVTVPYEVESLAGNPPDMFEKAVNYIIKTPGGNIYHAGDSHYSNMFNKHGKDHKIDIALGAFGENPIGMTDKLTANGILRMAESLNCEVVIPMHHDIWTNFKADPMEIMTLWEMKRHKLKYKFKPYIWEVGGKFIYPDNKDDLQYNYERGFEDAFTEDTDLPYYWIL